MECQIPVGFFGRDKAGGWVWLRESENRERERFLGSARRNYNSCIQAVVKKR